MKTWTRCRSSTPPKATMRALSPHTDRSSAAPRSGACPPRIGQDGIPHVRGETWRQCVVMNREARIGDVHFTKTTMNLVAAVVEPAADVLTVPFGQVHRLH